MSTENTEPSFDVETIRGLKALSIRQPWAWLIVHGPKRFENRAWSERNPGRRFRGRFLIHAAKGMTRAEYDDAEITASLNGVQDLPAFEALERGGIVGSAEVLAWWDDEHPSDEWSFGPGLELVNVEPLPFVPCKGSLGFFLPELPPSLARPALCEAVGSGSPCLASIYVFAGIAEPCAVCAQVLDRVRGQLGWERVGGSFYWDRPAMSEQQRQLLASANDDWRRAVASAGEDDAP